MSADPTRTTMPRIRLITTVVGLCLGIGTLGSILIASWRHGLPDPIATHFGTSGPNGFTSTPWVIAQPLIVAAVCAGVGAALLLSDLPRAAAQWLVGFATGMAGGIVTLMVLLVEGQRGLADATKATFTPWSILVAIAVGAALGLGAARLVPRWRDALPAVDGDEPVAQLGPEERFVWTRRATSSAPVAALAVVAMLPLGAVAWATHSWLPLAAAAFTLALVAVMWSVRVTITRTAVSIRSAVGWPRITISLNDIERAEVVQVSALRDYGGYGYRIGIGGRLSGSKGFVLRSGTALLLVKRDGGREVVVVDDAATAAGLVNAVCRAG
ncbi:DUF1648 domain-containing protein [Gordonia crocea]|uniref:DUF1648 domain-containing protein n=1 Tax=Gordonia crocea TaxID=589162 RepID=A0A7I9UZ59_9ACTN|nr:DUF1648 domain-containing protein [Gordonia crocea]GED98395.1 hypothetical protein nbrc107697_24340 [Gordonia crocea]